MKRSAAALVLLAASARLWAATPCEDLARLELPNVTLTEAKRVTEGTLAVPGAPPLQRLPTFCRVVGFATPIAQSRISFEVWLPLENWNGKYVQVGNGGLAGGIFYMMMQPILQRGFAVGATDNGHVASPTDGSWAIGQPEKVRDFGYRAVHVTRGIAGSIVAAHAGKSAARNYFYACSEGGREAHMEAQRYPEDFDGIVAGAPWCAHLSVRPGARREPRRDLLDGLLRRVRVR